MDITGALKKDRIVLFVHQGNYSIISLFHYNKAIISLGRNIFPPPTEIEQNERGIVNFSTEVVFKAESNVIKELLENLESKVHIEHIEVFIKLYLRVHQWIYGHFLQFFYR